MCEQEIVISREERKSIQNKSENRSENITNMKQKKVIKCIWKNFETEKKVRQKGR